MNHLKTGRRLAALATLPLLLVPAAPADAHPFGPPQTLAVSADDGDVLVRWGFGATDDISYLAVELGVLPEDRVMLDGAVLYEDGDDEILADAPEFADYLTEHIRVARAGAACEGSVRPTGTLDSDGIVVAYACPATTGTVAVDVDMLLDMHPAYQTMATGPDGQRAVYDADNTSHDWTLPAASTAGSEEEAAPAAGAGLGRSAALQVGGVLGALAAVGTGGWLWRRRRAARARVA